MSDTIVKKLKKYVLYISTIFFVISAIHLTYIYIYDGAESEAMAGGTISEAIIGGFPHFNPLVPSSDHNAYINGLLYRSMMEYSTVTESFESDLVSCSTQNLLYITCTLENNLNWSDGSEITTNDIKSTLNIIKETKVNPIIASLLEETTIETTKDTISFSNASKDINFLQIFTQAILPAGVIERLDTNNIEGKFSEINGVYSGRFVLTSISQDETVGITKITLGKNENYFGNDMYINFLILNLFRDEGHFLKNKNSFNIYNDKDVVIGNSIPRLDSHDYTLSQFVATFFNSETLPIDLREYISYIIDREKIITSLGKSKVSASYNPFLSDQNIDAEKTDFDLSSYLKKQGYMSKKDLLKNVIAAELIEEENENIISNEATIKEEIIVQETLTYINSPYNDRYNFVSKDNILLQGKVDSGVEAVYINDYKLSGFAPGDTVFYYRLLEAYDTIQEGENIYKLFFETNGEKEFIEEIVYIYNTDSDILGDIQENFFSSVDKKTTESIELPKEGVSISVSEDIQEAPIAVNMSKSEIQELDENFYYNANGEKFSLQLTYTETNSLMGKTLESIRGILESHGIALEVQNLNLGEITQGLRSEKLTYDIILLGIDLGYFESNIFPYFHSSQVQNGYNISNYKKLSLDILLEELKSNNLSITKREELETKMLEIIAGEFIIKVLYTPKIHLLVDKNIKNFSLPKFLPDSKHRYYPLLEAYLSEKRIIKSDGKGPIDFIRYLLSHFSS